MKLLRIKHFGIEFYKKNDVEGEYLGEDCSLNTIAEIEKEGEISEINHKINLDEVGLSEFMSQDNISNITNQMNQNDRMAGFSDLFRQIIGFKIASDLGLELTKSYYTPKPTIKEQLIEVQNYIVEQEYQKLLETGGI